MQDKDKVLADVRSIIAEQLGQDESEVGFVCQTCAFAARRAYVHAWERTLLIQLHSPIAIESQACSV